MSLSIAGLATANPESVLTQEDALELAEQVFAGEEQVRTLKVIYRRSGIQSRRVVLTSNHVREWLNLPQPGGELSLSDSRIGGTAVMTQGATTRERNQIYIAQAPPLAARAASEALARAEVKPHEVTHLITVSCSGMMSPGIDIELIRRLGLPATTQRLHVGYMACHGAMNGLRAANSFATADPRACVLMCAVELTSLHYYCQWDPSRFMANVIFGDGAAALVGRPAQDNGEWRYIASGSCLIPDSLEVLQHNVADHGLEVVLSARLPELIHLHLKPFLESWLAQHGLTLEQVGSWAIHPGGPRVISSVEQALGISTTQTAASREVLREFGNMSSPTILFILDRLRRADAPRPCVALAFGPGLTVEAALFA